MVKIKEVNEDLILKMRTVHKEAKGYEAISSSLKHYQEIQDHRQHEKTTKG